MTIQANEFIDSYVNWLRSNINSKVIGEYTEITTPFLDRHNDHLQIYVKNQGNNFLLTDDGYIINDLLISGFDFTSTKRQQLLETTLNSYGIKREGNTLVVKANKSDFPQKKHSLLQAMISVNDMFMTSRSRVTGMFLEDVETYLQSNDVRYTPYVQFSGKSGFNHTFDFVVPFYKSLPERLIKVVNAPTTDRTKAILFAWSDIKEIRKNSSLYVFLNDENKAVKSNILQAFEEYDIKAVPWSNKSQVVKELSA